MEVGYIERFQENLMPCQSLDGIYFNNTKQQLFHNKLKYKGKMALMCPICFSYIITDNTTNMSISMNCIDIQNAKLEVYWMNNNINYEGVCKNDHNRNIISFIKLDPNIAEIIKVLNIKGWKTRYCCESHEEESVFDGYIVFNPKLPDGILNTLPISWYHDRELIPTNEFHYYNTTIIRMCSEMKNYKGVCLAELLDWANNISKNHCYIKDNKHKERDYGKTLH